ncbi:hypothetical protein C1646_756565 [Rhizophagus diaphanus]|nr:hypothetical protein C1646_756565 [Rhizophagus diaphanus] [Rhizophagus sp. MUCL 43196]
MIKRTRKPGRETKLNDQDLKKKNELWKPGRETKLNDQDLKKERTMVSSKPGRETKLNDQDLKERTMLRNLDVDEAERPGFKRTNYGEQVDAMIKGVTATL